MNAASIGRARLCIVILITLTSMGLLAACDSMDRAEAVRSMNAGLESLELGNTMDAVRSLKEASQIDPKYADPPYYLGQIYQFKLSEPDNAERYYREALERAPDNAQIAYRLGMVLSEGQKWGEAEAQFRQAVQKEEDFAKAWFRLGLMQEMQGNYAEAVDSYMAAIKANPRMRMDEEDRGGAAYHALGDLYIRFGFYDKALKVYENAILNNDHTQPARLYAGRGVAQLKLKRFQEAAESFEKALDIDPAQTTAIFNLAVAHQAMGQAAQAIKGFEDFTARADPSQDSARIVAAEGFIQKIRQAQEEAEGK